jgi:hypothetical protein
VVEDRFFFAGRTFFLFVLREFDGFLDRLAAADRVTFFFFVLLPRLIFRLFSAIRRMYHAASRAAFICRGRIRF